MQFKKTLGSFLCAFLLIAMPAMAQEEAAQTPQETPPIQTGTGHRFVCTDYSGHKVLIVNQDGEVEWSYPARRCSDVWALPNGDLLFAAYDSVLQVNRDKEVVFEFKAESVVFACQPLANGHIFLAECHTGRLLEVRPDGSVAKEVRLLPEGADGGPGYLRGARALPNGHYLVCHYKHGMVCEYDSQGNTVRKIPVPGGPHSVLCLDNGNLVVSESDKKKKPRIWEMNPQGEIVWSVETDELPGIQLAFLSGFQRLANGNTVMTNWVGHHKFGQAPHIIEITPDKQVVWTFQDHTAARAVSSIFLLEDTAND